jgi:hypothetical protein
MEEDRSRILDRYMEEILGGEDQRKITRILKGT